MLLSSEYFYDVYSFMETYSWRKLRALAPDNLEKDYVTNFAYSYAQYAYNFMEIYWWRKLRSLSLASANLEMDYVQLSLHTFMYVYSLIETYCWRELGALLLVSAKL